MSTLSIALAQKASSLDPAENREAASSLARTATATAPAPDLLVLPEAFMRDFGAPGEDISAFAEPLDGPYVERLTQVAKEHQLTVVAGMFERSGDPARPYNTLVVVDADGLRTSYRKMFKAGQYGRDPYEPGGGSLREKAMRKFKEWRQ